MRIQRTHVLRREDAVFDVCKKHNVGWAEEITLDEANHPVRWFYITIPHHWEIFELHTFIDQLDDAMQGVSNEVEVQRILDAAVREGSEQ